MRCWTRGRQPVGNQASLSPPGGRPVLRRSVLSMRRSTGSVHRRDTGRCNCNHRHCDTARATSMTTLPLCHHHYYFRQLFLNGASRLDRSDKRIGLPKPFRLGQEEDDGTNTRSCNASRRQMDRSNVRLFQSNRPETQTNNSKQRLEFPSSLKKEWPHLRWV